jgi:hypothetical protein
MTGEGTGTVSTGFHIPCGEPSLLDVPDVLADLRAVVAEKGADYVYDREVCVYADGDGCPSCIVGHVLARRGLLTEEVAQTNPVAGELDGFTRRARQVLERAQELQDGRYDALGEVVLERHSWGEALAEAEALAQQMQAQS